MSEERIIVLTARRFWAIKLTLIVCYGVIMFACGYYTGTRRLEVAQQFGRDSAMMDYPCMNYAQAGLTYCFDRGNYFEAVGHGRTEGRAFKITLK